MHPNRYLLLLCVLMSCGAALWGGLAVMMAWSILRPPRMSSGKAIYHLRRLSPGDLGLRFDELNFWVRAPNRTKKLNIASWWIPAASQSESCVILIHGYADAKVGSIAWAPLLHDLHLNILAVDLRAHGDSDGPFCTGGFFERDDVNQVIDELLILHPAQTRELIIFGISLGAAVACAVGAKRQDIAAMVLESPFTDYKKAITAHTRLMRLPSGLLLRTAIWLAEAFSGASFDEARLKDQLQKSKCPVLMIAGSHDELLDAEDLVVLQNATGQNPKSQCWLVEGAGHLGAMPLEPEAYKHHVREFFQTI